MDKYYMLVRKFLYASFILLLNLEWDPDACSRYNVILTERGGPITRDGKTPTSLMYHLADIYLEEMSKALHATQTSLPAPLPLLLKPFVETLGETSSNITFSRIKDSLIQPALDFLTMASSVNSGNTLPRKRMRVTGPDYTFLCNHSCIEPKKTPDVPLDVKKSLLQAIFGQASHADTRDSNRRKLYAIWKAGMLELEAPKPMVIE